jgi:hypothetical protein
MASIFDRYVIPLRRRMTYREGIEYQRRKLRTIYKKADGKAPVKPARDMPGLLGKGKDNA